MTRRVPVPRAPAPPPRASTWEVACVLGSLDRLLDELTFPARRWQVVASAELAGADTVTLNHLMGLPSGLYLSLDHLRGALEATGRPVAGAPGQRRPRPGCEGRRRTL